MYLSHGLDNKKKISAPALVLALFFSALAGSLLINLAAANPMTQQTWPSNSPPSPIVEVINIDTEKLTVTLSAQKAGPWITEWRGYPDFKPEYPYDIVSVNVVVDGETWSQLDWASGPISVSLEGLSNGMHTLEVTATTEYLVDVPGALAPLSYTSWGSSGVMEFSIDNPPPSVSILSLTNAVADGGDFQFAFRVVGKSLSWVGYSLDGMEKVTVSPDVLVQSSLASQDKVWKGNLTLVGLSGGSRSLIVYAEEVTGSVGASSPFTFTVETAGSEQPRGSQPVPFPTTLVAVAIIASVAVVCFGLVAYFLRRRRRSGET
jgi:hypothetical protein